MGNQGGRGRADIVHLTKAATSAHACFHRHGAPSPNPQQVHGHHGA
jgi:hypothetical protein